MDYNTSVAKKADLLGRKFNRLTIIRSSPSVNGKGMWECECSCGKITFTPTGNLINGRSQSCGCLAKDTIRKKRNAIFLEKTFGRLRVIEPASNKGNDSRWICECACGNITTVSSTYLLRGKIKSCGCLQKEIAKELGKKLGQKSALDLTGRRFGKLTAINSTGQKHRKHYKWNCLCDCGNYKVTTTQSLMSGGIKSCGCAARIAIAAGHLEWARKYRISRGRNPDVPMTPEDIAARAPLLEINKEIRRRDNFMCQLCNAKGVKIHCHHIEPFAIFPDLRFDQKNIISLCFECHRTLVHRGNCKKPPDPIVTQKLKNIITSIYSVGYETRKTT